jgi:hypothetical protein
MAYCISQCHGALGRSDGGVEARHEPLDTGSFGGGREGDLFACCGNADGWDDDLLARKSLCDLLCRGPQVHHLCLHAPLS